MPTSHQTSRTVPFCLPHPFQTYQDVFEGASSTTFTDVNSDIENYSNSNATATATATYTATTTTASTSAVKLTARHAAEITTKLISHYWACVLFCRRWLNPNPNLPPTSPSEESIRLRAISSIVAHLPPGPDCNYNSNSDQQQKSQDTKKPKHPPGSSTKDANANGNVIANAKERKEMLIRFAWPTFMAAIETDDAGQRGDLLARLGAVRDASAECQWCWGAAREIVRVQTEMQVGVGGRTCWVDLGYFMQQSPVGLGVG